SGGHIGEPGSIGDVDRMRGGVAAPSGDLLRNGPGRLSSAIEDRDLRPRDGKGAAGRSADSVPAPGHEGDFSGEIVGHCKFLLGGASGGNSTANTRCREWPL